MENQKDTVKQPKKRVSPIFVPTIEDAVITPKKTSTKKAETAKKVEPTKSTTSKKTEAPKTSSKTNKKTEPAKTSVKKATSTKTQTKSSSSKATNKTTKKENKIDVTKVTSVKIDPRTGTIKQKPEKKVKEEPIKVEVVTPKKKTTKPKKPSIKSKDVTIEPAPRDLTPKEIVRPTPKKAKQFTKEEKVLYKKLQESFNTVANMATVIEERTMDTKNIPDLTIGELHVIETVNMYNNKPMTLIAKKMHVTVGSLTIGVNRLVQKGYLLRVRDEMDRRVILLSVTQLGKKVLKFHDKFHDDILGLVLDTIPLQQALKVMSQFAYILELYYDPSIEGLEEKKTNKKEKK